MRSFTEYRLKLKGDSKMNIIKSICVAFSMYSKIPMPRVEWNEKNMKYAMCFFPLIGAVIGGLMLLVRFLCGRFGFNTSVYAVVMTALPVLVSGGIHTDGFIDTVDALSSYGDKEKKLEILKDPHTGAFAIIGAPGLSGEPFFFETNVIRAMLQSGQFFFQQPVLLSQRGKFLLHYFKLVFTIHIY